MELTNNLSLASINAAAGFTEVIADCSTAALLPIIRGKAEVSSIIYTDAWHGYNGLVSVGYDNHVRIKKQGEGFAQKQRHMGWNLFGVLPNDVWQNFMESKRTFTYI